MVQEKARTKKIFFTGGGTAGHVTPNIALIEHLRSQGWDISYIGSASGIESDLTRGLDIAFYGISTGKLRRYFDWQNFIDPFKIVWGICQCIFLCLKHQPQVVFSKGGFVAVPLVVGAWLCRLPVISHESDVTPGLANKLCFPFSRFICVNFEQTRQFLPDSMSGKVRVTGSPVRNTLLSGDAATGRAYLGFTESKPVLLVFGGSLGARVINDCIRASIRQLLGKYQVIHIVGEGNVLPLEGAENQSGYEQREYLHSEFGDVLAAADIVIARAGANSIYELLLTRKLHLLVPLSRRVSRGDQIVNASLFEEQGMSMVIQEERLTPDHLLSSLEQLEKERARRMAVLTQFRIHDAVKLITDLILEATASLKA